jgi:hypothetical protein
LAIDVAYEAYMPLVDADITMFAVILNTTPVLAVTVVPDDILILFKRLLNVKTAVPLALLPVSRIMP